MSSANERLHELEDQLIHINGLMQALIKLLPDGNDYVCIANELEKQLFEFQKSFDDVWEDLLNL
ncbi:hypothetical protein C8N46_11353 [Kordia periserrulae]|uniref:Uncharacterized protein n=1 Tax=Kordia periserrulae TaxID=701523 RepID=A0A2T6BR85_9FLAO|nr:hypothetical protein [Kordia periserrulae]PTX58562.1 hypothetical protein C8N46_11353 [Kordia periserrulae]